MPSFSGNTNICYGNKNSFKSSAREISVLLFSPLNFVLQLPPDGDIFCTVGCKAEGLKIYTVLVDFFSEKRGVIVERVYCGSLMTSLEMAGVSLTLLRTDDTRRQWLGEQWPVGAGQLTYGPDLWDINDNFNTAHEFCNWPTVFSWCVSDLCLQTI